MRPPVHASSSPIAWTATTACGPVEYVAMGDGPAVVLIHGMPGSWRQAVPLAEDLADRHRVVLPSRPGYGTTPLSSGRTPSEQAALIVALLDELGIEQAAVVGISGGGPPALAFAHDHPTRATSLALLCAVASHLVDAPRSMRLAVALPPLVKAVSVLNRRRDRQRLDDPAAIDAYIDKELTPGEAALSADDPRIRDDLVAFLHSHADAPAGLAGLRNDARQIMAAARLGPAPTDHIVAPTVVMHGDADVVVPFVHAEYHAASIPGAVLHRFDDAGHVFLLTHRRDTVARLREHLQSAI